jgi:hypothetical protein
MPKQISRKNNKKNYNLNGGEPKKILVLCQRKTGKTNPGKEDEYLVEERIIPEIARIINSLMGTDNITIYMTTLGDGNGTADINCYLDGITQCSIDYIEEHNNSFDLILLQTCPFKLIKYDIIYRLLKPNALLGLILFPNNWTNYNKSSVARYHIKEVISVILSKNFVLNGSLDDPEIILFTKK